MILYGKDYTELTTWDGQDYITYNLEDLHNLNQVIYELAGLYEKSPYFRGKLQDGFKTFGLDLKKAPL